MDELMHYGVKGMKWGVHKEPKRYATGNTNGVRKVKGSVTINGKEVSGGGGGVNIDQLYNELSPEEQEAVDEIKETASAFLEKYGNTGIEKAKERAAYVKDKVDKLLKRGDYKQEKKKTPVKDKVDKLLKRGKHKVVKTDANGRIVGRPKQKKEGPTYKGAGEYRVGRYGKLEKAPKRKKR